jgi:hypothetical protein
MFSLREHAAKKENRIFEEPALHARRIPTTPSRRIDARSS